MTASHPLDRPVWNALTSRQTDCAIGDGAARRFAPEYGPLTGARDASPEGQAALAALPCDETGLWLLEAEAVAPPPGMVVSHSADCVQMVADGPVAAPDPDFAFVDLTEAGMQFFFLDPVAKLKMGFVVNQSSNLGVGSVLRIMGPLVRNIVGRMDKKQLRQVSRIMRQMME